MKNKTISYLLLLVFCAQFAHAQPQIQPLDMQGYQINNLANGTLPNDAVNLSQLQSTGGGITAGNGLNFSPAGTLNVNNPLVGNVTGNATTSTSLAANGTNCSAGNYPLGVDAFGNSESCTAAGAGATIIVQKNDVTIEPLATTVDFNGCFNVTSSPAGEANIFLDTSGCTVLADALKANGTNCSAGSYPLGVDASGNSESCSTVASAITAGLNLNYSPAGTLNVNNPIVANLTGNASTATALAANGTNCSAGNYPLGVDASGNSEGCSSVAASVPAFTLQQVTTAGKTTNQGIEITGNELQLDDNIPVRFGTGAGNFNLSYVSASSKLLLKEIVGSPDFEIDLAGRLLVTDAGANTTRIGPGTNAAGARSSAYGFNCEASSIAGETDNTCVGNDITNANLSTSAFIGFNIDAASADTAAATDVLIGKDISIGDHSTGSGDGQNYAIGESISGFSYLSVYVGRNINLALASVTTANDTQGNTFVGQNITAGTASNNNKGLLGTGTFGTSSSLNVGIGGWPGGSVDFANSVSFSAALCPNGCDLNHSNSILISGLNIASSAVNEITVGGSSELYRFLGTFPTGNTLRFGNTTSAGNAAVSYTLGNLVINPAVVGTGYVWIGDGSTIQSDMKLNQLTFGGATPGTNGAYINGGAALSSAARSSVFNATFTYIGTSGTARALQFTINYQGSNTTSSPANFTVTNFDGSADNSSSTVTGFLGQAGVTSTRTLTYTIGGAIRIDGLRGMLSANANAHTNVTFYRSSIRAIDPGVYTTTATDTAWAFLTEGDSQIVDDKKFYFGGSNIAYGTNYILPNSGTGAMEHYGNGALMFAINGTGVGYFGTGPVAQQGPIGSVAGFVAGGGTNVTDDSTFDGGLGGSAYTVDDIVLILKNYGLALP